MTEKLPQKVERAPVKQDEKPKRYVEKGRDVIFDNKTRDRFSIKPKNL